MKQLQNHSSHDDIMKNGKRAMTFAIENINVCYLVSLLCSPQTLVVAANVRCRHLLSVYRLFFRTALAAVSGLWNITFFDSLNQLSCSSANFSMHVKARLTHKHIWSVEKRNALAVVYEGL